MLQILIDKKMPEKAKETLSRFGELLEVSTKGITYEAVSGHPDIFFFPAPSTLIAAANLPKEILSVLDEKKVNYKLGTSSVGMKYPETARYNAAVSENFLIHRTDITEKSILEYAEEKELIHVSQGYSRCSLLPLKGDSFITSDEGICGVLKGRGLNVLYVLPSEVLLPGFTHGFFGGASGVYDNSVFLTGSLKYHSNSGEIKSFLTRCGYDIVELYDGPLFDSGSILFFENAG